jgi:hypothetical protein
MPCSFGLLAHPRSGTDAQPNGSLRLTVTVRWIPLVSAAYGTRVARPARSTMLRTWRRRLAAHWRVRPVLADHASWARGRRARGSRVGRLELHCTRLLRTRSGGCRRSDLRFQRTSSDRSCPLLSMVHPPAADPARTSQLGKPDSCGPPASTRAALLLLSWLPRYRLSLDSQP